MTDRNDLGRALACAVLLCACQSSDAGGPIGKADVGPVVGAGFSAALRADLSKATGMPMPAAAPAPAVASGAAGTSGTSGAAATGTAGGSAAGAAAGGTAVAAAGTTGGSAAGAAAGGTAVAAAGTTGGSAATAAAGTKEEEEKDPAGATTAAAGTKGAAGTAAAGTAAAGGTAVAAATPAPATPTPAATPSTGGAGLSPELAAVQLTLNEGWSRDAVGPGTFSFFAPGDGGKNIRFVFQYGYEDATAPTQREPYKTWLQTNKSINVTVDRQRGAAWFLEGTDGQNTAIFRYVITYGGRLLTCGGSLYKSGPGSGLRDLRDEIIMQAKRICESMDIART